MDFSKTLKSIEDVVYEVMVWILFLPKTLFRVTFQPKWGMDYILEEFNPKKEPDDRFDEYLSPVLLWLITTVIPFSLVLVFSGELKEGESVFAKAVSSDNFLKSALYMMIVPFVYIVSIEMKNKQSIRRSSLKRAFYKHCYALTPGLWLTAIFSIMGFAISPVFIIPALAALPIYEAFVFQSELNAELKGNESKIAYGKAFLYALVPQGVLVVVLFFILGFAFL